MKINQTYQFSDKDIEMLKIPLPHNPCDKCGNARNYCCGCKEETEYVHKVAEYKVLGIYDIARNIQEARSIRAKIEGRQNEIINLQSEFEDVMNHIPSEVLNFISL